MTLRGRRVEGRWHNAVCDALPDGEILFSRGSVGYQGSVAIVARLDDGRWLQYEWSYGSCSGCDRWDDIDDAETIYRDVREGAAIFDPHQFLDYLVSVIHNKAECFWEKIAIAIAITLGLASTN